MNSTSVNSTSITVCEAPANATNCPYYTYLNVSAFTCLSTCGSLLTGQTCCTTSLPLVPSAGSIVCQATCSPTIYILNGTINQCNATCALPYGIQTTSIGSPATFICSACATFIQRSNSSCVTSCGLVNTSQVNSTWITVCETTPDATNCPYR